MSLQREMHMYFNLYGLIFLSLSWPDKIALRDTKTGLITISSLLQAWNEGFVMSFHLIRVKLLQQSLLGDVSSYLLCECRFGHALQYISMVHPMWLNPLYYQNNLRRNETHGVFLTLSAREALGCF